MDSTGQDASNESGAIANISESENEFSERATREQKFSTSNAAIASPTGKAEDLQVAGAMEAIELYKGLLKKYPMYARNDQVMYQLLLEPSLTNSSQKNTIFLLLLLVLNQLTSFKVC